MTMQLFKDVDGRYYPIIQVNEIGLLSVDGRAHVYLIEGQSVVIDEATFYSLIGEAPATPEPAKRRPMSELTAADGWVLGTSCIPGPTGAYRCAVIALNTGGRLSLSLSSDSMALHDFAGWIPLPSVAK